MLDLEHPGVLARDLIRCQWRDRYMNSVIVHHPVQRPIETEHEDLPNGGGCPEIQHIPGRPLSKDCV